MAYVYVAGLLVWATLRTLVGDRYWWTFLLNAFALYLFAPLPAVVLAVLLARSRSGSVLAATVVALWADRYAGLFLAKERACGSDEHGLTVMTMNVLFHNRCPEQVVAAICASDADVIGIQELNPAIARAIARDLARDYPYQVLAPHENSPAGMGTISRYPLHPTADALPGEWLGAPQVLSLTWQGRQVTVLNLHPVSSTADAAMTPRQSRERARAAHALVRFARECSTPLIITTDFNVGDQNTPYAIVTQELGDAWRAVGWGLGHTFPGALSSGSSRPVIRGIAVPKWLLRIDYVFYSRDWRACWARIGPWDAVSDHRPVLTHLVLARDAAVNRARIDG